MATEFLRISDLHAFYGESHILHGVDMVVNHGEVVTLLGRNGAGRTTTLKSIMGLVGRRTGSIKVNGVETVNLPPHAIARMGIGYCPEERGIFASLSCEENLMLPPAVGSGGMGIDEIYAMFPNLKERRESPGTRLSGGEQQMLAVARILRTGARLLLLDEISEGLAPVIVQEIERAKRSYQNALEKHETQLLATLAPRCQEIEIKASEGRYEEAVLVCNKLLENKPRRAIRADALRELFDRVQAERKRHQEVFNRDVKPLLKSLLPCQDLLHEFLEQGIDGMTLREFSRYADGLVQPFYEARAGLRRVQAVRAIELYEAAEGIVDGFQRVNTLWQNAEEARSLGYSTPADASGRTLLVRLPNRVESFLKLYANCNTWTRMDIQAPSNEPQPSALPPTTSN